MPVHATDTHCLNCGISLIGAATQASNPDLPSTWQSSSGTVTLQSDTLVGGRYRLTVPLGASTMGNVWRASDERLHNKPCALKQIVLSNRSAEERTWFDREAATLAGLSHPGICAITDQFEQDGYGYLVLEMIQGRTLSEELVMHGSPGLSESEVHSWVRQLGDALAYLHCQVPAIIFRDIKPQNIMLRQDGRVALIDFGIARPVVATGGTTIGTPGYAPPEQYQGIAEPRSDQYALAATLHHLLTGRDPSHQTPFQFPPVRSFVPSLSQSVDTALARALSMRVDDRYDNIADFVASYSPSLVRPPANGLPQPQPVDPAFSARAGVPQVLTAEQVTSTVLDVAQNTGSGLRNIQDALGRAQPGAVIRLAAGEYVLDRPLEVNIPITLIGAGMDRTSVVCAADDCVMRFAGTGPMSVSDLSFVHLGARWANVVEVTASELAFAGCRFTGGVPNQARDRGGTGLSLRESASGTVVNCEMVGNNTGIELNDKAMCLLEGNSCQQNKHFGILYMQDAGGKARQNTCISNGAGILVAQHAQVLLDTNTCQHNELAGITFGFNAGGTARQNTCSGNGEGISIADEAQPLLEANSCQQNKINGISYSDHSGGKAHSNICSGNSTGIAVSDEAQPQLDSNLCQQNKANGIDYMDNAGGTARQNTCLGNGIGIFVIKPAQPSLGQNNCRGNARKEIHDWRRSGWRR
jgi:parallel beta-helix repeat protein